MLLRTAVTDMGLHTSFQSVSLGKLTCCLSARIRIRHGQTDGKTLSVNLEGQAALPVIVGLPAQIRICRRVLRQPLFERSIVRLNFNGFAGFVKIDAGRFLPLGQSGFHVASISACSAKTGAFSSFFLNSTPAKANCFWDGERPDDTLLNLDAPIR